MENVWGGGEHLPPFGFLGPVLYLIWWEPKILIKLMSAIYELIDVIRFLVLMLMQNVVYFFRKLKEEYYTTT